jgi:hypothetical protein
MKAGRYIWVVALISAALVLVVDGQENPVAGNPAAIQEGASLFRANCSPCTDSTRKVAGGDRI